MKKKYYGEMKYVDENEKKEMKKYIEKYNKRLEKRSAISNGVLHSVKYILYTPLSIAANIVSVIFKFCGSVTSIGIPYGIYCTYKVIKQLCNGVALCDTKQTTFVCLFMIFPFIAFGFSLAFEKLANYFTYNK